MLSSQNQSWLDRFIKKHGRAPRVLHIGNIANNAYNNAKILSEAGMKNYVICYDYYHIMGCPEWEDADFPEFTGDQFKPEWFKLPLGDFQRSSGFIQGPLMLSLKLLNAILRKSAHLHEHETACLVAAGVIAPSIGYSQIGWRLRCQLWIRNFKSQYYRLYKKQIRLHLYLLARRIRSYKRLRWTARQIATVVVFGSRAPFTFWRSLASRKNSGLTKKMCKSFESEFDHSNQSRGLQFGVRGKLSFEDLLPYFGVLKSWADLALNHADYIIGYSTDPIIPMLCGREYYAFEHGTIREIPYHDTPQGRLTALAYRKAQHVFVTNFDCRASAEFLAPGRYTMINHPFDEDHGEQVTGWEELRRSLQQELDSDFLLFHPTRQDWVEGTGYADKANDVFLKAFCELRNRGLKIGLVCCDWGNNVSASKQVLQKEKCMRYVKWVQPLPVVAFERTCLACDIVVDQFKLGSFGGVLFKAMAVGCPILTFLDEKQVLQQYAECPPVINCRTQQDIVAALSLVFAQPEELERLGKLSREWIKKHHGKAATVNAQVDQFRLFDLSRKERNKDGYPYLRR